MKENPVVTRRATAGDIPEIQRLYRQLDGYQAELVPQVFRRVNGDARRTAVIQTLIDGDDADYIIAEVDGTIVGFVDVQRSSHPDYPMFRPHEFALVGD